MSNSNWLAGRIPGNSCRPGAGLCCGGPVLFGAIGLSGAAGALASLPFLYHVILQWIAMAILLGAWSWFLYKWRRLPEGQRWTRPSILTGIILILASVYVIRSWFTHVLV